jgi:hypothetical protein
VTAPKAFGAGADDGIRTRDLRFTKPLLYQLSYVGKVGPQTLHRGNGIATALRGVAASLSHAPARDSDCEKITALRKSRQLRVVRCVQDYY